MKTKIIYMGTPDFSVNALLSLAAEKQFKISLVVTQPDRPKGRGRKLMPSPVKTAAQKIGLEVFQPENINSKESIEKLLSFRPDFFVVAAFGQILTEKVLNIPRIYPINIHASLLPKYRGSSPIQAAIYNMDKKSGITTMVMAKGLDTGDILLSATTSISQNDTAQDLHDTLSILGADLIIKTIQQILKNKIKPIPQDHSGASYVKMLKKSDGKIDWKLSGRQICAHINAMTPWPGAFSKLEGKRVKIYKAVPLNKTCEHDPGVIFECDKQGIHVAAGDGCVSILELMGTSGKRLKAFQFLCGHKIDTPAKFDC
jgi:methionyl-tRNA formyltransferase